MDFGVDERAQSVLVGAILLFAILITAFSTYQAFVVPNQNAEVEFNHNQRVQNDMVGVRNELLSTYTTGQDGYAEIELGTQFPPRLLAINPPPPSGTFQTDQPRPIVVETQSGTDITDDVLPGGITESRIVSYDPTYSEYNSAGVLRYENSVAYHDFGDSSVQLTGQRLIQGNTIQIVPVPTEFDESGSRAVAIEPQAGLTDRTTREDIVVTLPTELSESEWEEILSGELDPADISVTEGAQGRNLTLTLDDEWAIDAGPVGLGSTPGSPRSGGVNEINPAAPGNIRLESETVSGSTATLTFNNTAGTNNFTRGRINFYDSPGQNQPTEATVRVAGEPDSATLLIGGQYEEFDPDLSIEGETTTDVEMEFDRNPSNNAWFVVTFQLETGESAVYFVGL
jgi:hypothetical protein